MVLRPFKGAIRSFILHCRWMGLIALKWLLLRDKRSTSVSVKGPYNILVMSLKRWGDNVIASSVLSYLRSKYPNARIVVLTTSYAKALLDAAKLGIEVFAFWGESWLAKDRLLKTFADNNFDLCIDLSCDETLGPAFWLWRFESGFRVGYGDYGKSVFFHRYVLSGSTQLHALKKMEKIIQLVDPCCVLSPPALKVFPEDVTAIDHKLSEYAKVSVVHRLVCIHPGGTEDIQRWSLEKFAGAANEFLKRKYLVAVLCSERESGLAKDIGKMLDSFPLFAVGWPPGLVMALLTRSSLLICNNSGLLHLASALGCPTVSVCGPTDLSLWAPLGNSNEVIFKPSTNHNKDSWKEKITIADVLEAAERQLNEKL